MWSKRLLTRSLSLLTALLVLSSAALPGYAEEAGNAEELSPERVESRVVTARFWDPLDCTEYVLEAGDSLTVQPGPEIEGYRFLGWQDTWGNYEKRGTFRLYEDTDYYAVYAIALQDSAHRAYLAADDAGFAHPWDTVSRREAALLVYRLLHTELVGDGSFLDVSKSDPCHDAVATLKTLGAISGSRFHPNEAITRFELLELLSHFYPQAEGSYAFSDLSESDPAYPVFALAAEQGWIEEGQARMDDEITRAEAARIFNRVLGREGDKEQRYELVGTILDLPRSDPYFWDMAEALIPHDSELHDGEEYWTKSEALPLREAGPFFIGVRLHYVDESGDIVADCELDGLTFNSRGEITSGSEELDKLIWDAMAAQLDPATMDREQMLREMFLYTAHTFHYVGRNLYEMGETGWERQEALDMLQTGRGNCYSFASVFYYFARALGYKPEIYSGLIRGDAGQRRPHGWVEIEIDGEICIFDPEMQFLNDNAGMNDSFYKRGEKFRSLYGYQRAEDIKS